jgi:hypothetical protein
VSRHQRQQLRTAAAGHVVVRDQDIDVLAPEDSEGFLRRSRAKYFVRRMAKAATEAFEDVRLIIHQ